MEKLQVREKEIFEILKRIKNFKFVVLGGYAVNAYTLPRFSVDCDMVVNDDSEWRKMEQEIKKSGFKRKDTKPNSSYQDIFAGYEKTIKKNFRVTLDILHKGILDRQTGATFTADWVFDNSELRLLRGKTITEQLRLRIINLDALIVMKLVSCRLNDIRDVFMLMPNAKDIEWIRQEVSKRCDFNNGFLKLKEKVLSPEFKNNLQGAFGYIDEKLFDKHKKKILELEPGARSY